MSRDDLERDLASLGEEQAKAVAENIRQWLDWGGSAFPGKFAAGHGTMEFPGMALRDYFAGQALIGIAWDCGLSKAEAAETAYEFADAMLAQRTKP
jgi:hypothetical protein